MYPKLSKRKTADGDTIYTYVCRMKERSQRNICNQKNATGNTLDMAVIEQLKSLLDNKSIFYNQLRQSRKFYTGNRTQYEEQITSLKKEKAEIENKINVLIDSLVTIGNSSAKNNITKRIEKYNTDCDSLEARIRELTGLVSYHTVSDSEFDVLTQMLLAFKNNVDEMSVEKSELQSELL